MVIVTLCRVLKAVYRTIITRMIGTRFKIDTMNGITNVLGASLNTVRMILGTTSNRARVFRRRARPLAIARDRMVICNGSVSTFTNGNIRMGEGYYSRHLAFAYLRFKSVTLVGSSTTSGLSVGKSRLPYGYVATGLAYDLNYHGTATDVLCHDVNLTRGVVGQLTVNGANAGFINLNFRLIINGELVTLFSFISTHGRQAGLFWIAL